MFDRLTGLVGQVMAAIGAVELGGTVFQGPVHRLDRIEITVKWGAGEGSPVDTMQVVGRSDTKRANLWSYVEAFEPEADRAKGYSLYDAVAHVTLACQQDRPNSLARLKFSLSGGLAWDQDSLWPE